MNVTNNKDSMSAVRLSASKRKFDGDKEEAGSAKIICLESSSGDNSSLETPDGAEINLPAAQPTNTMAPQHSIGVDYIEDSEMKTDDDKKVAIKHVSIQVQAKQSPLVPLNSKEKETEIVTLINSRDDEKEAVFSSSIPVNERDGNDDIVPTRTHEAPRAKAKKKEEDEVSCSSESSSETEDNSLLSAWSDDTSQEGVLPELHVSSKYQGLKRLEKRLKQRKKRLKRLCEGQPPAYVHLLRQNEKVAAEIKVAEYLKENPDEVRTRTARKLLESKPSFDAEPGSTWRGILEFERLHTLPCAYAVTITMLVHTVFYAFIDVSCRIIYETFLEPLKVSSTYFYTGIMILGMTLLRLNGGIFFYSGTMAYHRAHMEMSNRFRIGMLDAKLFKQIKGNSIGSYFNMFGYYFVCVGIYKFYNATYQLVYGKVDAWMGVVWEAAKELMNAEMEEKQTQWVDFHHDVLGDPWEEFEVTPSCIVASDEVTYSFLKPIFIYLCNDLTFEYKSVELAFHTSWLLIVAYLSFRVGHSAMELCD